MSKTKKQTKAREAEESKVEEEVKAEEPKSKAQKAYKTSSGFLREDF